jgi:hypothetical protein
VQAAVKIWREKIWFRYGGKRYPVKIWREKIRKRYGGKQKDTPTEKRKIWREIETAVVAGWW